jgi:glycosyltransferase involved in cell wall biosynthesis
MLKRGMNANFQLNQRRLVTAIIPTFNEEKHISEAIDSVAWADEILVVDSFSTDQTVQIAKSKGVTVIQREYGYSASQKNWAIPQAKHEWIFLLDADERCTSELQDEIVQILSQKEAPPFFAYWIYRKNHFMGKAINYSGWQSDKVVRFFHQSCRYQDLRVHAEIIVPERGLGLLKNKIQHFTYSDLMSYLKKADRYTTWGAYDRLDKFQKQNKKIGYTYLIGRPLGRFFRHYFLRLGFLDGTHGLVVSLLASYNVFIRALKIWRLQNGEKI